MNVREMHIEVEQSLQQVAANRTRKFFPEEIDWVLNKMQERFITSRLVPKVDGAGRMTGGFELDIAKADAIRMLLVSGKSLTAYKGANASRYRCFLPPDYSHLIADASLTTDLCGSIPKEQAVTLQVSKLRQDFSDKASGPFYTALKVVMPNKTVQVPGDLPYGNSYAGYPEKTDISFLVPWIALQGQWYWERFEDLYYPGHYIQVQEGSAPAACELVVDTVTKTSTAIVTRNYKVHPGTGTAHANRLTPSEIVPTLQQNPYYRSAPWSPVSELSGNSLWIYTDGSFTVNGVEISYIRKAQPISLSLNTDCELAPEFHQPICDLAVEYLKGRLENDKGTILAKTDLAERVIL